MSHSFTLASTPDDTPLTISPVSKLPTPCIVVGLEIIIVGDCVYPIPAFLIKISDIVLSASRFTSAAAGDVLAPTIETVGVAAYPTPLFVIKKSIIPKFDCSTAAVAAAPTPPPPVIVINGGVVYPAPAFVSNILSIENIPALVVVIATAVAFTLPGLLGAVEIATLGVLV